MPNSLEIMKQLIGDLDLFKWLCEVKVVEKEEICLTGLLTHAILHQDVPKFREVWQMYDKDRWGSEFLTAMTLSATHAVGKYLDSYIYELNIHGKVSFRRSVDKMIHMADIESMILRLGMPICREIWPLLGPTGKTVITDMIYRRHEQWNKCLPIDRCTACERNANPADWRWSPSVLYAQMDADLWIKSVEGKSPV